MKIRTPRKTESEYEISEVLKMQNKTAVGEREVVAEYKSFFWFLRPMVYCNVSMATYLHLLLDGDRMCVGK